MAVPEEDSNGFECIFVLVDLGASDGVLPNVHCMDIPMQQNETSKGGYKYEVAEDTQ